ncbi:hypothetical protein GCM10010967_29250 [Dyadobacter beijingensis]|uniref:Secretion system C-terminal sorting domain-containing protein n=1 Tax=Dyadobacter beijingensis TaxID=365489 RepID=A0ABQ2HY65_9BACT|nr:T9SS type A sorting domain-containing protein [Dyadobacter beijingensis]GGM94197.1 hypothetical protein GCM10010967_29250 [Dyadobacter beijingensis]
MKYLYAFLFASLLWSCNNPPEIEPEPALTLVVYPNPTAERVRIHVENDALHEFTLQIFDTDGEAVFEQYVPGGNPANSFDFDPTPFGTGAFHAVLRMNGSVYTKKFMIL